ncbi:MAG: hypothetical protein IK066_06010 [Kiritimatiellae bacterium]|nr:hypothetical protein [Kiritimatiellia bacterium]
MSLFKNPTIFVLLWKVLFIAFVIVFLFIVLLDGCQGRFDAEHLAFDCKVFGIGIAGMTVLAAVGYLVYAAIMGEGAAAVAEVPSGTLVRKVGEQGYWVEVSGGGARGWVEAGRVRAVGE